MNKPCVFFSSISRHLLSRISAFVFKDEEYRCEVPILSHFFNPFAASFAPAWARLIGLTSEDHGLAANVLNSKEVQSDFE